MNGQAGALNANSNSGSTAETKLLLREWSVSFPYSSFYLEQVDDLDVAAEALVRAGVASAVYVSDGSVYWLKAGELRKEVADLRWREHEHRAEFRLPDGIDGWAAHGTARALLQRFREKTVFSPLSAPQHEYLRAVMEPSILGFADEQLLICSTLKLYKTGVFAISYEIRTPEEGIGVTDLIKKYVNLFTRYCDEAWVPHAIARITATTQLHRDANSPEDRLVNLGLINCMRAAAEEMAETIEIEGFEFVLYPAHRSLDKALAACLHRVRQEVDRSLLPESAMSDETTPMEQCADATAEIRSIAAASIETADVDNDQDSKSGGLRQDYNLYDMFANAGYAIRSTIDPPSEGESYIRDGLKEGRLTQGDYWHCRPQVSIAKFDGQRTTASEIREMFGDDLGRIMVRAATFSSRLARAQLGDSLRPFEDYSVHLNSAISLCVRSSTSDDGQLDYTFDGPIGYMCAFELIDYLAMRCHQLDQRARLVTSAGAARAVRADLIAVENLARTAFRAGELTDVTMAAWERLRLPLLVHEIREKVFLAAEAATEKSGDQHLAGSSLDNESTGGKTRVMSSDESRTVATVVDFVVITALEEERDAVLSKLPGCRKLDKTSDDIRTYYEAEVVTRRSDGAVYRVVVTCLFDTGPQLATAAANAVVVRWHPSQVLLVGIACGLLGETEYGDVLVPKQVADYSSGKLKPDGSREIRWEVHRASANLLDSANHLANAEWADLVKVSRPGPGEIVRRNGVVASGGDVVSNDAIIAEYQADWPKLIGIEMEAGGTATGVQHTSDKPDFLMIKAVSDHGKDKKNPAVLPWRAYACDVAAAFAIGLIRSGPRPAVNRPAQTDRSAVHAQREGLHEVIGAHRGVDSLPDRDRPQLKVRPGVDADRLFLTATDAVPATRSRGELQDFLDTRVRPLRNERADPARPADPPPTTPPPVSTPPCARPSVALRGKPFVIGGSAMLIVGAVVALAVKGCKPLSCPEGMVLVHAGVFSMGSREGSGNLDERPEHKVTLPAYCIGKNEVTVKEYAACAKDDKCPPAYHTVDKASEGCREFVNELCNDDKRPNHPINCVDWNAAKAYCSSHGMRLPTEEEWEYAARGDDRRAYPWGDAPPTAQHLNACGTECTPMARFRCNKQQPIQDGNKKMYDTGDGWVTTAPVGSFPEGESLFHALDMAGNVWEWTASPYVGYSAAAVLNPSDTDTSSWHVLRGGGWQAFEPGQVRSAIRLGAEPGTRNTDFGFRCAKDFP